MENFMFCPKCGNVNPDYSQSCSRCGLKFNETISATPINTGTTEKPTPKALIAIAWVLMVIGLIPSAFTGVGFALLFSFGTIVCGILLIVSKNKVGKTNGWIIIIFMIIINIISFFQALGA
jgi:hypothetical protein